MDREQFSKAFRRKLKGMPREEIAKTVSYYEEMIADKIEGGMSEREAVASLGDLDDLARSARGVATGSEEKPPRTHAAPAPWVILLIVLGSPLWIGIAAGLFGMIVGFFAVIFSLDVTFLAILAGLLIGFFAIVFSPDVALLALIAGSLAGGVAELAKAVLLIGQGGWQVLISAGTGILLVGVGILLTLSIKPVAKWTWEVAKLPLAVPKLGKTVMLWSWKAFRLPWIGWKKIFGRK